MTFTFRINANVKGVSLDRFPDKEKQPWHTAVLVWMPELKLGPTQHSRAGLPQLW